MSPPIQYAEYEELVDILSRSNHETSYTDLMQKEDKVLKTVNAVIKHHQQKKATKEVFTHMTLVDLTYTFLNDMNAMFKELVAVSPDHPEKVISVLTQGNRLIYWGIILIFIAFVLALSFA